MSCWSEPLHQSFVWEESSRKGPLTHWTRPFNIQAPPPQPQLHTYTCAHILHTRMCGTTRVPMLFYLLFSCDFRAKLKHKHWEPEARAERHLPCSRPIRLSPSISNKKTSAFIANQGREKNQDRVADCLHKSSIVLYLQCFFFLDCVSGRRNRDIINNEQPWKWL